MSDAVDQELVSDLALDLLAEVAPSELPIFPAVSKGYFATGGKVASKREDEPLGFGLDIVLLTPYLLSALGAVATFLANEVVKAVKGEASSAVADRVRRLFKKGNATAKGPSTGPPLALTREDATRAHKLARERAESLGLSSERAQFLADAIVGSLVVA